MRISIVNYKEQVHTFLDHLREGVPAIFFDLETTGLSALTDRIISCSGIKLFYQDGILTELGRLNVLINPGFQMSEEVIGVHGITNEQLKCAPREHEVIDEIMAFFGEAPLLAGYNSTSFDEKFMQAMYERSWGDNLTPLYHLDVFQMSKEKVDAKNHTLEDVAKELGCDIGLRFHNSLNDVLATIRVFQTLLPSYLDIPSEPAPMRKRVRVVGVNHWRQSHRVNRLYVKTEPYTKTFYDIYKKEWRTDGDHIDLSALRADVLEKYQSGSEKALIKTITGN